MQLLEQGEVFAGRYRVERFLARGGHGVVYVAEQLSTEAPVALKVLLPSLVESGDAMDRFALEAKVAGRVRSDFIVKVLDAGRDSETGLAFLAMELLEGESLEAVVDRDGPLEPERLCTYLAQVASGLDRAHGYTGKDGRPRPIIRRDLKPDNLFLARRENGEAFVKILDFGIAKVVSETAQQSQGTKGTPLYMAFEQLTGEPPTPETDVWALGLIVFFLLTGKCYWASASKEHVSVSTIFAEILHGELAPPSQRARALGSKVKLPAAFDAWFEKCVNRDPMSRFPSAGEASKALAESLMGLQWAATLPVGTPAPAHQQRTPRDESDVQIAVSQTKPEPPRPSRRALWIGLSAALVFFGGWALKSAGDAPQSGPGTSVPLPSLAPTPTAAVQPAAPPSVTGVAAAPPVPSAVPEATRDAGRAAAKRVTTAAPQVTVAPSVSIPASPYDRP